MQDIVGERLPKFSEEEIKLVKGSVDFVGINQYTSFYMFDPHKPKPKVTGYQEEWNAGFACKIFSCLLQIFPLFIASSTDSLLHFVLISIWCLKFVDDRNGVPIGPRVMLI